MFVRKLSNHGANAALSPEIKDPFIFESEFNIYVGSSEKYPTYLIHLKTQEKTGS